MTEQAARLFWDEEFAWDAPAPREIAAETISRDHVVAPAPVRVRRRPERRDAWIRRRRARAAALARLAVLATAVAALVIVSANALRSGEDAAEPKSRQPETSAPEAAPAQGSAVFTAGPLLRMGASGVAVSGLQHALVALGFEAQADGSFAGGTRDAVATFQADHGLAADGVVGPETSRALHEAVLAEAEDDATTARNGLRAAVADGRLAEEEGKHYDAGLTDVLAGLERLPLGRAAAVALALDTAALHADAYEKGRAAAVLGAVEDIARYVARKELPRGRDLVAGNGIVYRLFPSRGFQFHPIANVAALNALVTRSRTEKAHRQATALAGRGVTEDDGLVFEYYFPYGGPPRWRSGFAQGVAAEALARAGALSADPALADAAKAAFRAIEPELVMEMAGGLWIREYSHTDMPILNAQLQTLLSVSRYVEVSGDLEARVFAGKLETAARALLSRFDTGCWSLYSLGGGRATPNYHRYHIALLEQLDAATGEPPWGEFARRWQAPC